MNMNNNDDRLSLSARAKNNNYRYYIVTLSVEGMMCQNSCGSTVENALLQSCHGDVVNAHVSHRDKSAIVCVDLHHKDQHRPNLIFDLDEKRSGGGCQILDNELQKVVEAVGFDCALISACYSHTAYMFYIITLGVEGMMCQKSCGSTVQNALLKSCRGNVVNVHVSHRNKNAIVCVDLQQMQELLPLDISNKDKKSTFHEVVFMELRNSVETVGFDCMLISSMFSNAVTTTISANVVATVSDEDTKITNGLPLSSSKSSHDNKPNTTNISDIGHGIIVVEIGGMSCTSCTGRVERALMTNQVLSAAAIDVRINLATSRGKIQFQGCHFRDVDDDNNDGHPQQAYKATKNDDNHDDIEKGYRLVEAQPNILPTLPELAENCIQVIQSEGYQCELLEISSLSNNKDDKKNTMRGMSLHENASKLNSSQRNELNSWRNHLIVSLVCTIPLLILKYIEMHDQHHPNERNNKISIEWIIFVLSSLVQFGVGYRFNIAAYHSLKRGGDGERRMGMDALVTMGTTAAYVYSCVVLFFDSICRSSHKTYDTVSSNDICEQFEISNLAPSFETSAMLLTFVTLGKFLETYAKNKTADAISLLMQLQPTTAYRVINNSDDTDYNKVASLSTEEISLEEISVGDYIVVLPGSRIPTDGVLIAHEGRNEQITNSTTTTNKKNTSNGRRIYVDESALSGEPFPVAKAKDDALFGGCVNQNSLFCMKVTATGNNTMIARIVRLIEDAQTNKAPIESYADLVASYFVPTVLSISFSTFLSWMIMGYYYYYVEGMQRDSSSISNVFFHAIMCAISVMVVACPCALGLATPTAVMVGTGVGAANGLLIKGGAVLEEAHAVDTVVFDKTGTLTTGKAVLGDLVDLTGGKDDIHIGRPASLGSMTATKDNNTVLWLASCAEAGSEHPLAQAIVNYGRNTWGNDVICAKDGVIVSDYHVSPGEGVECKVQKEGWGIHWVRVGKKSWVDEGNISNNVGNSIGVGDLEVLKLRQKGQIGIYLSITTDPHNDNNTNNSNCQNKNDDLLPIAPKRKILAVLGIVDPLKEDAKSCIVALQKNLDVDVWMCTGDHEVTAMAVALKVGINSSNVCFNVSPEGKADFIKHLKQQPKRIKEKKNKRISNNNKRVVAMVGDGINDAVALTLANVGIAVGAGTDLAVEAADIVLVRNQITDVVIVLHLSRVVFDRIYSNFFLAMGYNTLAMPLAAGALYPLTNWTLPPAFAGLMMACSSVSVVMNSLSLRWCYRKPVINDVNGYSISPRNLGWCFCNPLSLLLAKGERGYNNESGHARVVREKETLSSSTKGNHSYQTF